MRDGETGEEAPGLQQSSDSQLFNPKELALKVSLWPSRSHGFSLSCSALSHIWPCPQPSGSLTSSTWGGLPRTHQLLPGLGVKLCIRERGASPASPQLQGLEGEPMAAARPSLSFRREGAMPHGHSQERQGCSSSRKSSFRPPLHLLPVRSHRFCVPGATSLPVFRGPQIP